MGKHARKTGPGWRKDERRVDRVWRKEGGYKKNEGLLVLRVGRR